MIFSFGRTSMIFCKTVRPPIPESNNPIALSLLIIGD
jgi:hypothetical protein